MAKQTLTPARIEANERWFSRGRLGEGRIELDGQDLRGGTLPNLPGARLVDCDAGGATMPAGGRLDGLEARGCKFERASLDGVSLPGAVLDACSFTEARLRRTSLRGASVSACSFESADLEAADWNGARLAGVSFRKARLTDMSMAGVRVEACDFREADLGASVPASCGGAYFKRCDFRGARFAGRSLAGATFEDCAFHGVSGVPVLGDAIIVRADLSIGFDGSLVLVDPVTDWTTLQSSTAALAGIIAEAPVTGGRRSIAWVEIPGGRYEIGLDERRARRLAEWVAGRARQRVAQDPDQLHGDREQTELEDMWGNPDYLIEMLAFSRPAHTVTLAPFAIAAMPVTVGEYAEFVRQTGARPPEKRYGGSSPDPGVAVTGISWHDAAAYAAWRDAALPTEAQWERAARGPQGWLFPWGDEWGAAGAWLDAGEEEAAVGTRTELASPEGVHELVTHLAEWTADEFAPYPGADQRACDRVPPPPGGWWGTRTQRGPLVGFPPTAVTRRGAAPDLRLRDTTFRLVRRR
jgi:formylglycine-generating enzyme required for sulfatase activity/uncharacterized protein YjbI with pentapeptide repeats